VIWTTITADSGVQVLKPLIPEDTSAQAELKKSLQKYAFLGPMGIAAFAMAAVIDIFRRTGGAVSRRIVASIIQSDGAAFVALMNVCLLYLGIPYLRVRP
jgi:hypothetical protein